MNIDVKMIVQGAEGTREILVPFSALDEELQRLTLEGSEILNMEYIPASGDKQQSRRKKSKFRKYLKHGGFIK